MEVIPYKDREGGKKEQVRSMFDGISRRYDLLNHLLSLNIDKLWRKRAIRFLSRSKPENILDIATGTGDFAIAALKANPKQIIGIDISEGMLEQGRAKMKKRGLDSIISLQAGDCEALAFGDNYFDAAIVAFGVRNFENLDKGISEVYRVLKPGGNFVVLEFSKPRKGLFKYLFSFYFKYVLPKIGAVLSGDPSAYTYLPESVQAFPEGEAFQKKLNLAGFSETGEQRFTFGICSMYTAVK